MNQNIKIGLNKMILKTDIFYILILTFLNIFSLAKMEHKLNILFITDIHLSF